MTLFPFPKGVTVSGDICIYIRKRSLWDYESLKLSSAKCCNTCVSFLFLRYFSRDARVSNDQIIQISIKHEGGRKHWRNMQFLAFAQSIVIAFLALWIESLFIQDGAVATLMEMFCIAVGAAMLWCKLWYFIGCLDWDTGRQKSYSTYRLHSSPLVWSTDIRSFGI